MKVNSSELQAAVFLDRDGTMIEDVGTLRSPAEIKLFPDTVPALKSLQDKYRLFVITNQSGIAKGEVTQNQVDRVNEHLDQMLRNEGVFIEAWYVCPHHRDDGCSCIKPKPEFVLRAQDEFGIDLSRSFVIGDHPHDVKTGAELGVYGLYLLTGHGGRHLSDLASDHLVFHRISDAAEWIINHPRHKKDLQKQIEGVAQAIRNGEAAAFPTETVYGLGADVFQTNAVEQIFRIKERPHYNPLIAHICDMEQVNDLASHIPDKARVLMEALWPGPLTVVLPKRKEVPDLVTGGLSTVAIRMPAHPIALDIIRRCGTPVAAPSANRFTCTSPTTAQHVREQLGDRCRAIVDGGACRVGVESTVISFTDSRPVLLRPGGLSVEEIEQVIGAVERADTSADASNPAESPGMMPNHYAPATKLCAYHKIPAEYERRPDIGVLLFQPDDRAFAGSVEILSTSESVSEAATHFFAALRRLDALKLSKIVAEYAPASGLGCAINNRLEKAANGRGTLHA